MQYFLNQPTFAAADKSGGTGAAEEKTMKTGGAIGARTKTAEEERREKLAQAMKAREASGGAGNIRVVKRPKKIRVTTKLSGWFRVHPEFRYEFDVFQPKNDDGPPPEPLFVAPDVMDSHPGDPAFRAMTGYLAHTVNGAVLLFIVPTDMGDGELHPTAAAKHEAAHAAHDTWMKMVWDKQAFEYELLEAHGISQTPQWPESLDPIDVLSKAFGDRMLWEDDHPVLQAYRGES